MRIDDVAKPPTWVRLAALGGGNSVDPISPLELKLDNAAKPAVEEPAMTHPFNTSVIKIRNNGMIDAWVGTDQGIRLDPNSRTINMITDGLKEHLNYFRAWVTGDLQWWAKSSFLFNSEGSSFTVNAATTINHNAGGNINQKAGGDVNVQAGGSINMKAGANINMTAGGTVNVKGSTINIDAGGAINIRGGGNVSVNGGTVKVNGGTTIIKGGAVHIN